MARPVGWVLTEETRAALLDRFPPRHDDVVAHHVTQWGRRVKKPVPGPANFAVVGRADAGAGIEALVVTVDGETRRPDGSTFHITWSIDPDSGKRPKDSNMLIADHGWTECEPVPFEAEPGFVA
jgi:hypothetical protein